MKDRSVLAEYMRRIKERFPSAHMRLVRPSKGADFVVRIEVAPEQTGEVLDLAAAISYELYRTHRVGIAANVPGAEQIVGLPA